MSTNVIGEFNSSTDEWDLEHASVPNFKQPFSQLPSRLAQRLAAQTYLVQRLQLSKIEGYDFTQSVGLWCKGTNRHGTGSMADVFAHLVDDPHPHAPQNKHGLPFEVAARGLDLLLNDPAFIRHVAAHRYHINTALWFGRLKPAMAEMIPDLSGAKVEDALLTVRKEIQRTVDTGGNPIVRLSLGFPYVEGEGEHVIEQAFPVTVGPMSA